MRQISGRAHLERSWVLSRADLTEPEPPRAHGQVHALGSAELSTEALRQPVSEDQHSSRECSETSPDSSSVCSFGRAEERTFTGTDSATPKS